MATIVQDIVTNVNSIAATVLGASYHQLRFIFSVEKNDIRAGEKAYGCRPLAAIPAESVTRHYTLDHDFELILTDTIGRSDDDTQRSDALNTMYDKADEIFKELVNTKVGLPLVVLLLTSPSLAEPEILNDQKLVVLRMNFTVRYRSAL